MIEIIFGLIIGVFHYFSEDIFKLLKKKSSEVLSFSAGISITYIFLHLFPQFSYGVVLINKFLFLSILAGFAIFHIVEKYIYQHYSKDKQLKDLAIEDSTISFIYHFVVGVVLVSFFNRGFFQGILFFIPSLLYTTVSTMPVDMSKYKIVKFILALSTLCGVIFAKYIYTNISPTIFFTLLGFIIGALSFTVTRHSIPAGKKGRPLFFVLGVVVYALLIYSL